MADAQAAGTRRSLLPAAAVWPVGALHYLYLLAQASGERAIDLFSIWSSMKAFVEHRAPYYVIEGPPLPYPPSSLVVLAPLGVLPFGGAKAAMVAASGLAAVLAGALLLEAFGVRWRSVAGAVLLLALGFYAPVVSNLVTGNVNALILATEAGFLFAASRGRWMLACALLGAGLAIKPVLLPLVVLPLLWKKWRETAVALSIPAVLSGVGLVAGVRVSRYFTDVLPFLLEGEGELKGGLEQFNMSLVHAGNAFGVPGILTTAARVGVVLLAAWLIRERVRERFDGDTDALRLAELSGLLLLPAFLSFSSSLAVYGLFLLPLFVSVVHPRSIMRAAISWLGVYAIGTTNRWNTDRLPPDARTFASLLPTWGYLVLLAAFVAGIASRRSAERDERAPGHA